MPTDVTKMFEASSPDYLHPFKKSVKEVLKPQITVQPPPEAKGPSLPDLIEIADLCEAVKKAHLEVCKGPLGYLRDEQDRRHAFYPSGQPTRFSEKAEMVTLASLLSKSMRGNVLDHTGTVSMTFSRIERYSIAVTLASSLLQLYPIGWQTSCKIPWHPPPKFHTNPISIEWPLNTLPNI